jgi:hypothetical protein
LTPAQLFALSRPCFSPADWLDGVYQRVFPIPGNPGCGIVCSMLLTVDVGDDGAFIPTNTGPAAWHVNVGFVRGTLLQALKREGEHVPPATWTPRLLDVAASVTIEALAGVGGLGRDYHWMSVASAHHWRPLRGHELDGIDAAAERIGRLLSNDGGVK